MSTDTEGPSAEPQHMRVMRANPGKTPKVAHEGHENDKCSRKMELCKLAKCRTNEPLRSPLWGFFGCRLPLLQVIFR